LRNRDGSRQRPTLARNFLHAAALEFTHPRSGKALSFSQPLPAELEAFLEELRAPQ
jgi:23S rRNA-/tRNA-specific pseudouridylate synthase